MARATFLTILAIAAVVRLVFVFLVPAGGGDWDIYSTVAQNIIDGCGVSLSPPGSGQCLPHFGGNQLPGFPAFAALMWAVSGQSDMAIRVAQTLCYVAALGWLMRAVSRTISPRAAFWVGLLMALSPLQVAWPRFTQTETLALATNIWVAAELLLSLGERRLRMVPLAVALAAAIFIRLDAVLLALPVAVLGFILHRPAEALRRGALLAVLVSLPLAGWTIRNIVVGLPRLTPAPLVMPDNAPAPVGYLAWGKSWVTEEYQRMGWAWPTTRMVYGSTVIDGRAYDSAEEKAQVEAWLEELATYQGQAFPPHIDQRFAALAAERTARDPWRAYVGNNVRRAMALWSNPFSSFAWPNELPGNFGHQARLEVARGGVSGALALAARFPFETVTKALTGSYRYGLLLAAVVAAVWAVRRRPPRSLAVPVILMGTVVLARTLFFAFTNNVETRYTVEAVPWMELAVVVAFWAWRSGAARRY